VVLRNAVDGHSNILYAWAGCILFKSIDAGVSWQSDASHPPDCSTDGYVFIDPHDPKEVYLGQTDFGVQRYRAKLVWRVLEGAQFSPVRPAIRALQYAAVGALENPPSSRSR
jgi:hypothetical protein